MERGAPTCARAPIAWRHGSPPTGGACVGNRKAPIVCKIRIGASPTAPQQPEVDLFGPISLLPVKASNYPCGRIPVRRRRLLWAEVQGERRNPEASQWRKLEALCGYDPDEAPEGLVAELLQDPAHLGAPALEEVAAQGRHKVATVLRQILALADANGQSNQGGFRCTIPDPTGPSAKLSDAAPHDLGARLARQARQEWNLGRKPIRNEKLAELLGTEPGVFARSPAAISPMIMALRPPKSGEFDFYINQSPTTSRRFATARLIADHLQFCNGGRLLPATSAGTQRQKVQRAFAQEFLCPIDALLEKIQTEQPDEYDFAEAADFFDVSPLLVKAALVNHGHLDREALSWAN